LRTSGTSVEGNGLHVCLVGSVSKLNRCAYVLDAEPVSIPVLGHVTEHLVAGSVGCFLLCIEKLLNRAVKLLTSDRRTILPRHVRRSDVSDTADLQRITNSQSNREAYNVGGRESVGNGAVLPFNKHFISAVVRKGNGKVGGCPVTYVVCKCIVKSHSC
jgi:hypothetical protein